MGKAQKFFDEDEKENSNGSTNRNKIVGSNVQLQLEMNLTKMTTPKKLIGPRKYGNENGSRKVGTGVVRSLSMNSPMTSKQIQSVKRSRLTSGTGSPFRERNFNSDTSPDEISAKKPGGQKVESKSKFCIKPIVFVENVSDSKLEVTPTRAVDFEYRDPLLTGDYSGNYVLPVLEDGKLSDIKEISGQTLTELMSGKYDKAVDHYEIIDCRYPYEYLGGHIQTAINLPTQQSIFDKLLKGKSPKTHKEDIPSERMILIFHCEFSSQRGPGMARYLREADRTVNLASYPALHYPEFYVLSGGYLEFFQNFPEFCNPRSYVPMDSPVHVADLHEFRLKSKDQVLKSMSSRHMKKKLGSSSSLPNIISSPQLQL